MEDGGRLEEGGIQGPAVEGRYLSLWERRRVEG